MYRLKDKKNIISHMNDIQNKAIKYYINNYEPTIKEMNAVYNIIKKYIKNNNRIIYGGYAQNSLIKAKNENDTFYTDISMADIEFYTPEPLKDIITLVDILHQAGYKYVKGQEGAHPETYKIFVNFINYCDITYMPKHVFNNCPTIKIENMKMTHPHFMLIDSYRVYSDILTSNFRLEKTFNRTNSLMNNYMFDENAIYNKISYDNIINSNKLNDIHHYIRKNIIHQDDVNRNKLLSEQYRLIVIGHYAFNYLIKKINNKKFLIDKYPYYQLISSNLKLHAKEIKQKLIKKYGNNIYIKEYYPFFQFFDNRIDFYYKNQVILKLYGNNDKCIPFKYSYKKKTFFGSFQLIILYLLIDYNYAIINNFKHESYNYLCMITRLFKARITYLEKKNISIIEDSPFQIFTIDCTGKPENPIRASFIKGLERIKQGKNIKFNYHPKDTNGKIPNHKFKNSSGNLIINNKDKILN